MICFGWLLIFGNCRLQFCGCRNSYVVVSMVGMQLWVFCDILLYIDGLQKFMLGWLLVSWCMCFLLLLQVVRVSLRLLLNMCNCLLRYCVLVCVVLVGLKCVLKLLLLFRLKCMLVVYMNCSGLVVLECEIVCILLLDFLVRMLNSMVLGRLVFWYCGYILWCRYWQFIQVFIRLGCYWVSYIFSVVFIGLFIVMSLDSFCLCSRVMLCCVWGNLVVLIVVLFGEVDLLVVFSFLLLIVLLFLSCSS